MITDQELALRMKSVEKYCSAKFSHSSAINNKILNKIVHVLRSATRSQMQIYQPKTLMACIVKIIFYYEEISLFRENMCEWRRRKKLRVARDCYEKYLKVYLPEKAADIIEMILNVMDNYNFWGYGTFCCELIQCMLTHDADGAIVIKRVWKEINTGNMKSIKMGVTVRILYELLDIYSWPDTQETVIFVEQLLTKFHDSVIDAKIVKKPDDCSEALKKGFELCVRNITKHLSNNHLLVIVYRLCSWTIEKNISDDVLLNFGSILEFAAHRHHAGIYEKTLNPSLFSILMQMIASESPVTSMLGNKVIQYLIDRQGNKASFDTPRIFFEDTYYELKVGQYHKEDKFFFKTYREVLHDSLLKSVSYHCESRMNLEITYLTICLIAIEVPCGFVAAAIVCLVMNIQDYILQQTDIRREVAYHVHATVIAIMSLLSWIHKAKVFYDYVNKIMMERAQWAPHLNPPIRSQYDFAVHHILWNKPELFFVDWEARYGLWKCFRFHEDGKKLHRVKYQHVNTT